jgi:hypothetical protein
MLALFTAYTRVLAGSLGATQHFSGPMAKPHRMFALTLAAILSAVESLSGSPPEALRAGLVLIAAGSIVTAGRRIRRLSAELHSR